ncbi:hypothetical protein LQZ21_00165 [Treponema sp. TIM-1]|uniref:hypothetical protein n=1 Tax=Treponema sp. TIM-1 TaxID=2898417 RepID=UPI0039813DDF
MNFKTSGIAAGIAFVLSLSLGLIRGAGIFALARAFIFAAAFFLLSGGVYWLILRFLPELLEAPGTNEDIQQSGSMVDISLEDDSEDEMPKVDVGEYTPEGAAGASEVSPLENLSGLDQKDNIEYTNEGSMDESPSTSTSGTELTLPADSPGVADELPDLESLSAAFLPGGNRRDDEEISEFIISPDSLAEKKTAESNTSDVLDGDFSAHDMASAVQTILKRE